MPLFAVGPGENVTPLPTPRRRGDFILDSMPRFHAHLDVEAPSGGQLPPLGASAPPPLGAALNGFKTSAPHGQEGHRGKAREGATHDQPDAQNVPYKVIL